MRFNEIVKPLRVLTAALLLGFGAVPVLAAQPESLAVGNTRDGQLAPAQQREFPLVLEAGDYVEGSLEATPDLARFVLQGPQGEALRRFDASGPPRETFRFVAEVAGKHRLVLEAGEAGSDYRLTLKRQLPLAEQVVNAPAPRSPRLRQLNQTLQAGGDTSAFWAEMRRVGTPLVEDQNERDALVTFLWRGAERNVRLFGAPSGSHDDLMRLGNSDVWYRSYRVPVSTQLSYRLAPDVPILPGTPRERRVAILATAQADPLNRYPWPEQADDRFSRSSTLTLAKAPDDTWVKDRGAPAGRLERLEFASEILGNRREITLYRPAGYRHGDVADLLFVFDAEAYLSRVPTPRILDNLIAAGEIPPTVAVFVANPDRAARARELPCNAEFARFMASELRPWVVQQTGISASADRTVLAGSSYGGLASACVAGAYPEAFGAVLSQSGSFWWAPEEGNNEPEWLTRQWAGEPRRPLRFYLSAGLFEVGHGGIDILPSNRHLRNVLRARDYPVHYEEFAAGHDYYSWRVTLARGLIALLGEAR